MASQGNGPPHKESGWPFFIVEDGLDSHCCPDGFNCRDLRGSPKKWPNFYRSPARVTYIVSSDCQAHILARSMILCPTPLPQKRLPHKLGANIPSIFYHHVILSEWPLRTLFGRLSGHHLEHDFLTMRVDGAQSRLSVHCCARPFLTAQL